MKKSLVALAVLAASGAYAQSSVTLFGIVEATTDIGYNRTQDGTVTTNTFNAAGNGLTSTTTSSSSSQKNNFRVQDGSSQGSGSSRVGFRGTEDLGGGLKANFLLEMGLRVDDGCTTLGGVSGPFGTAATAATGPNAAATNQVFCNNGGNSENSGGATFGRNAWGGLSGGFGEVRLGRQVLGSFGVQGNSGASGASNGLYDASTATLSAMGGVRFSNAIRYLSPNFGGFTGSLMLAAPETAGNTTATTTTAAGVVTTANASRRTVVDLALEYANGPAYIGFGYNKNDSANSVASNGPTTVGAAGTAAISALPTTTTGYTLGGSYDLGVVKPFINYTRQKGNVSGSTTFTSVVPGGDTFTSTAGDTNQRAFSIGLRAPVGAFTVIAGYGRVMTTGNTNTFGPSIVPGVNTTTAGRTESKVDAFQLGAQYALSKRTLVEANYGYNKLRGDASTVTVSSAVGANRIETFARNNDRISALNVGLKHSF